MVTKPPSKPGRYKEKRIVGGTLHFVMTENGKIVEDLGPVKKEQTSEQEKPQIVDNSIQQNNTIPEEQKHTSGLQLVTDDDTVARPPSGIRLGDILKRQEQKSTDNDTVPMPLSNIEPENTTDLASLPNIGIGNITKPREQKPTSNIKLVPISTEDLGKILASDVNKPPSTESTPPIPVTEPISPAPVPEPLKPPQIPEIKIPKIQINIPQKKDDQSTPAQLYSVPNKLGDVLGNIGTYPENKEINVAGTSPQKADVGTVSQQLETNIKKSKPKERRRHMEDELEAELLNERKFEEWIKKQKFRENLEKAARFAEETKQQFEEKIPELSNKIEGITGEVKGVESRLGTVDKSVGDLCTGVDCIKEDVKKYQASQEALEKLVQDRFQELGEKVQGLEHPLFTCENCGEQAISPLSSYCPNCGSPIHSWSDESGEPIRGWSPYWKRMGRDIPQ